jgi:hypothetical protein
MDLFKKMKHARLYFFDTNELTKCHLKIGNVMSATNLKNKIAFYGIANFTRVVMIVV